MRTLTIGIIHRLATRLRTWLSHAPASANLPSPLDEVKKNTPDAFDYFWASDYARTSYLEQARKESFIHLSTVIGRYAHRDMLDIGCGPGYLLQYVLNNGSIHFTGPVIGVDYSKEAILQACSNVQGASFIVADASRLPFNTGAFSFVSCIETLEHVKDTESIISELARVTSEGGTIIISVPNGELDTWDGHQHFFTLETLRGSFPEMPVLHEECINENRIIVMAFQKR